MIADHRHSLRRPRGVFDFAALAERPVPAIFAHRGASRLHRANTLRAFTAAIALGADGIEVDVRRTRDGVLVVHHNARPLGSSRRIASLDYDALLELARRRAYHVPTLEETLDLCAGRAALDLELKESGYEAEVVRLVRRRYDLRHVAFTSFRGPVVAALRKAAPRAALGLLVGPAAPGTLRLALRRSALARKIDRVGADFIAPHRRLVTRAFSARMEELGVPVAVWTVNTLPAAQRLTRRGVAILITDLPGTIGPAVRSLGEKGARGEPPREDL